jgi:hypothetical protein
MRLKYAFVLVMICLLFAGLILAGSTMGKKSPPAPECGKGLTSCGDKCVNTQSDPLNCGGCEKPCGAGESCDGGECQPGEGCNKPCPADENPCTDEFCQKGKCVSVDNAASCDDGNPCTIGDVCSGGSCRPGTFTCSGTCPCSTGICSSTGTCVECESAEQCSGPIGEECLSKACINGKCVVEVKDNTQTCSKGVCCGGNCQECCGTDTSTCGPHGPDSCPYWVCESGTCILSSDPNGTPCSSKGCSSGTCQEGYCSCQAA